MTIFSRNVRLGEHFAKEMFEEWGGASRLSVNIKVQNTYASVNCSTHTCQHVTLFTSNTFFGEHMNLIIQLWTHKSSQKTQSHKSCVCVCVRESSRTYKCQLPQLRTLILRNDVIKEDPLRSIKSNRVLHQANTVVQQRASYVDVTEL